MPAEAKPPLSAPVTSLRGIGPERAAQLARLELHTIEDLLLHRPRRYEDRRRVRPIAELKPGEATMARGKVVALGVKRYRKGAKSVFELILDDGSARLHCRWWNLPFMENYFHVGDEVIVFGKPLSLRPRTMDHPETEVIEAGEEVSIHLNRITPIYPLTEGLPQRWLRSLMWRVVAEHAPRMPEPHPEIKRPALLPTRAEAVRMLHFPEDAGDAELARRRLALDEFLELQLAIQRRRRNLLANARGLPCAGDNRFIRPFLAQLGFQLTDAQTKVLREIRRDLGGGVPMRRLLQGDVGSGKTVVAACAALMTLESGFNVALMAPTEILAEQHWRTFSGWFRPLGLGVELQTGSRREKGGSTPGAARSPSLLLGTHALLEEGAALENLGLVIIDEQHKFGVAQRERLVRKGHYPHLLVMTATPIPRTLGLTVYGDLDVSVMNAMPAGRGRVKTFVRGAEALPKVWKFVRAELAKGRQAYVVYPRVEEDEGGNVKAVTGEFEKLRAELAPYQVGLLHGRLRADEKERIMADFLANQVQVLLATTVVEVGLNVPNATVMVIENAERYGLAQLHQLRGRIGRGAHESYCILIAAAKTDEARARLRVLEETTDGFAIAEADLRLRGPGELLGQAQSGVARLRFGDLAADGKLVEQARALAAAALARKAD
jgi:ATP-dependent DNA helicase RecG